ncbi:MAG: YjiH family protein [Marinifilaceae bacterium]
MTNKSLLKFIVPSAIGVLLFIFPVISAGSITIPIALLSKKVVTLLTPIAPWLVAALVLIASISVLFTRLFKPQRVMRDPYLKSLLYPNLFWSVVRFMGLAIITMLLFKIGPEWVWSDNTGGLVLNDLLPILLSVFVLAGLFLPLLLNFGLLEFIGALLTKVMRPVFKLPGRASIDCVASWLGDGTIGVLLTSKQYEQGYYTQKEAAIIGTTFSAVSITFSLVVIETVGLGNMFVPFYATVTLAGFVAAIVVPRIPPLSRKKDTYYNGQAGQNAEVIPQGYTTFQWGVKQATEKAVSNFSFKKVVIEGLQNVFDMWIGVIPVVLTVGTSALIIAEYTSIFQWLGVPFIPLLKLLQIPEAAAASQTMVVGFADMFIPSVMAAGLITSPLTKFVIAALSVTQLIYMAEVGGLLLGSKIPISLKDLIVVFLLRTLVTLPVIALVAHLLF